MDYSRLKPIEKRELIVSAFEKACDFGGDFWQTNAKGRLVFQISNLQLDLNNDRIIIKTEDTVFLDPRYPIFLRLSYRNLISRVDPGKFEIIGNQIICEYPDSVRALDMRKSERYVLPFSSNVSLSLRRVERSLRDLSQEIELRIIDFSEKGFGILISGANREFLTHYDHYWITAIDQKPLKHMIFGSVSYIAPKGYYLKRGEVRVGLNLDSAISQEILESLRKKCKKVLTA